MTYGVTGRAGNAVRLDGSNDYISVGDSDSLDVNDFTVSLWMKYNGTGTPGKSAWTLIDKNPTGDGYLDPFHQYVLVGPNTPRARVGNGSTAVYIFSDVNISDSNWHYITLTRSGNTITLYTDGAYDADSSLSGYTTNDGALILGVWPAYGNYFNGDIDEVQISDSPQTADWIKASYYSQTDSLIIHGTAETLNSTNFVYDGDGNRVQKTEGGQTILYINRYFEKNLTTGENTTYYYMGNKLVAKRTGTTLNYMHQDHLGGTVLVTSDNGTIVGSTSYDALGNSRNAQGDLGTDKLFTGQRLVGTGLYDYKARFYDPGIGRFISADTLVQEPNNPQALNRYSYVVNNPLKYTDPTGHWWDENDEWHFGPQPDDGGGGGGSGGGGDGDSGNGGTGGPSLPLGPSQLEGDIKRIVEKLSGDLRQALLESIGIEGISTLPTSLARDMRVIDLEEGGLLDWLIFFSDTSVTLYPFGVFTNIPMDIPTQEEEGVHWEHQKNYGSKSQWFTEYIGEYGLNFALYGGNTALAHNAVSKERFAMSYAAKITGTKYNPPPSVFRYWRGKIFGP